ncbi:MAG: class I SAM-dependent methyltransferase [Bacteroidales bacterium]|nr:class I SAM-dependent methyltransferase [Bacteroidales bacterium]
MKAIKSINRCLLTNAIFILLPLCLFSQDLIENPELDRKVKEFLEDNRYQWRDMNIPAIDGQLLFDIIVQNGYTRALEIGTSTGHSAIWIAWALSKTGGKLITIEISERRYNQALENFREAGLADYIDARLADAHELVPDLKGPFDFVFNDADKYWYKNYFIAVDPKLVVGGCFTAHNITERRSRYSAGQSEFLDYIRSLDNYKTIVNSSGNGVSISYKQSK